MINDDNKTEIIDLFLAGILEGDVLREVEERMKTDKDFRREVALQQKIIHTVRKMERESLKYELSDLFQEENATTEDSQVVALFQEENATTEDRQVISINRRPWYYAIAAAVALLGVAGIFWIINNQDRSETYSGYLAVQLPHGARGELPATVPDSIPVQMVSNDTQYDFHYQLSNTLILYGDFDLDNLSLFYEPNEQIYLLQIEGVFYPVERKDEVTQLSPEVQ